VLAVVEVADPRVGVPAPGDRLRAFFGAYLDFVVAEVDRLQCAARRLAEAVMPVGR
jgi:hypothetical protein